MGILKNTKKKKISVFSKEAWSENSAIFDTIEVLRERTAFAYGIDTTKNKEYIIVGELERVRALLSGDISKLEEYEYPLGTLISFILNRNIHSFDYESFEKTIISDMKKQKVKKENIHIPEFSEIKTMVGDWAKSGNVVDQYCATKIDEQYNYCLSRYLWFIRHKMKNNYVQILRGIIQRIFLPFNGTIENDLIVAMEFYNNKRKNMDEAKYATLCTMDLNLFCDIHSGGIEFVYTDDNLYSIACYSLRRLVPKFFITKCSICDKYFTTTKQNIVKYCSDECREEAKAVSQNRYNESYKMKNYLAIHRNVRQSFSNRRNEILKSPFKDMSFSIEVIEQLQNQKDDYLMESSIKKKLVERGKLDIGAYVDWMFSMDDYCNQTFQKWKEKRDTIQL